MNLYLKSNGGVLKIPPKKILMYGRQQNKCCEQLVILVRNMNAYRVLNIKFDVKTWEVNYSFGGVIQESYSIGYLSIVMIMEFKAANILMIFINNNLALPLCMLLSNV